MEPDSLRQLLDQHAETRRHFDVVAEDLRADNRLLAESVAGVASRLERLDRELRAEMAEGFTEVKSMIRLSYTELDGRLQRLENWVKELQGRVERLEAAA